MKNSETKHKTWPFEPDTKLTLYRPLTKTTEHNRLIIVYKNTVVCCFICTFFLNEISTYPGSGPPFSRSNTWQGLRSFLKELISSSPWQPPDLTFTNTSSGFTPAGTIDGSMLGNSITAYRGKQSVRKLKFEKSVFDSRQFGEMTLCLSFRL